MRSIYKGTCQVCGSIQKLPSGNLSNHGYTTKWGFFMGTCKGSKELPLEKSCDVVIKSIQDSKELIKSNIAKIEVLKTSKDVNVKLKIYTRERIYKTIDLVVTDEMVTSRQYEYENRKHWLSMYSIRGSNIEEMVTSFNENNIKELESMNRQVESYIKHQTKIVESWTKKDLILIEKKTLSKQVA